MTKLNGIADEMLDGLDDATIETLKKFGGATSAGTKAKAVKIMRAVNAAAFEGDEDDDTDTKTSAKARFIKKDEAGKVAMGRSAGSVIPDRGPLWARSGHRHFASTVVKPVPAVILSISLRRIIGSVFCPRVPPLPRSHEGAGAANRPERRSQPHRLRSPEPDQRA
jgi:hypothetical protein